MSEINHGNEGETLKRDFGGGGGLGGKIFDNQLSKNHSNWVPSGGSRRGEARDQVLSG